MKLAFTIILGLCGMTTLTRADTVFDFTAPVLTVNAPGSPLTLTEDGITLTATGATTGGSPSFVARTLDGVGVWGGLGDSTQTDGSGPDEILTFEFDTEVDLVSVTFTRVGFDDDATLALDGDPIGTLTLDADDPLLQALDLGAATIDLTGLSGTILAFGVPGFDDDYKIHSLTVASIPEPAAGALLAVALLAAYRRRRRVA